MTINIWGMGRWQTTGKRGREEQTNKRLEWYNMRSEGLSMFESRQSDAVGRKCQAQKEGSWICLEGPLWNGSNGLGTP